MKIGIRKLEFLPEGVEIMTYSTFSGLRFDIIPACDGQTDTLHPQRPALA